MFRNKVRSRNDILTGNITEQLLLLLFPIFLTSLLQQIYAWTDSIIIGNFIGKEGLAATGGSAQMIINFIVNFIAGIVSGVAVGVAQNYGRRDQKRVYNVIKTGVFLSFVVGLIFTLIPFFTAPYLLEITKAPIDTIEKASNYLKTYSFTFIPYMIYQMGVSIFRATGDSKKPIFFVIVLCVLKITLDLLMVGVFKLEILGVALSTIISYLVCALIVLIILDKTEDICQYSLIKDLGLDSRELKDILGIGIPSSIQNIMFSITCIVIQMKINVFGTDVVAAYSAYNNVDNLFWVYENSLGAAIMTMAGQNFGRNNTKRVKKTMVTGIIMSIIGAIFVGGILFVYGHQVARIFTKDAEVIEIASQMIKIVAASYWLYAFIEPAICALKACGQVVGSMYISLVGICGFRLLYLLVFDMSSYLLPILAFPLSWLITGIAFMIYFFTRPMFKN